MIYHNARLGGGIKGAKVKFPKQNWSLEADGLHTGV